MAELTRVHPVAATGAFDTEGKELTFFTVDYINAVDGSAGPNGAQAAVMHTIQHRCVVAHAGGLFTTNTEQTFAVEGDFTGAAGNYDSLDGSATDTTFVLALQDDIRALGTVDGIVLTSATVTEKSLQITT
jgi:hypothetical protein